MHLLDVVDLVLVLPVMVITMAVAWLIWLYIEGNK
jgi:hypothetical protein